MSILLLYLFIFQKGEHAQDDETQSKQLGNPEADHNPDLVIFQKLKLFFKCPLWPYVACDVVWRQRR